MKLRNTLQITPTPPDSRVGDELPETEAMDRCRSNCLLAVSGSGAAG